MEQNNREFILVDKKNEAENITSLFFKPADSLDYPFISGQYVNIKPLSISGHGKSYTISSSPYEKLISLTIKRMGNVSSALLGLSANDKLLFDGPYGYFYPEEKCDDVVMIAGGIGVTPFYSIIKSRIKSKNKGKVLLFYSNKSLKETTFFEEFNDLAKNNPQFKVVYNLTQEKVKHPLVQEYSRINEKLLKKYLVSFKNKCFCVCGSIQFVNDLWKMLKDAGVKEENILTESFF